ncbi:hypothetical protein ACTZWT_19280 [Rhodopseudomonas sp. NSM]|uniref:hypothetical protein n=1 Tax=Rhodopseudomonas sp. NSM TaxID=3457630 RepID=UPI004036C619
MVLDAVARIEQNLAAQKQNGGPSIVESLVAIRAIVGEARAGVARAIAGLENDAVLAAAHDGARIIREVSWTLRECGADIRICNLLDSQVTAIDAGHRLVAEIDVVAVTAAFDGLLDRIHDLAGVARESRDDDRPADRDEPVSPIADGEMPEAAAQPHAKPVADVHAPAAVTEPATAVAPEAAAEAGVTIVTAAEPDEVEFVEPRDMQSDDGAEAAVSADQPSFEAPIDGSSADQNHAAEPAEEPAADVDAMLDLVALEMSVPQPPEPGEIEAAAAAAQAEAEAEQTTEAGPSAGEPSEIERIAAAVALPHEAAEAEPPMAMVATAPSIDVSSLEIGERGEFLDTPQPMAEAPTSTPGMTHAAATAMASEPVRAMAAAESAARTPSPSLGAAVLASGIVGHPVQSRSDLLAPLRRMSQAEKVAFFS